MEGKKAGSGDFLACLASYRHGGFYFGRDDRLQEAAGQGLESTRQCIKRVAEELHTHGRQAAWRLILTGYSQMMSSEKRIMISTRNRWALVQERSLSSWVVCNTWFFFACTRSCAMVCYKRTARGSTEQNSAANVAVLSAGPWK